MFCFSYNDIKAVLVFIGINNNKELSDFNESHSASCF